MKKGFYLILGAILLTPTFLPDAFAISLRDLRKEVYRPDNLPAGNMGGDVAEMKINHVLNFFIELILYAAGGVAVLMLVIGGIVLITSTGNETRMERAKKIVQYAVVGLFAVILAYAIVTNVIDFIFRATT